MKLSQVQERIYRLGTGTVSAVRQPCNPAQALEFLWNDNQSLNAALVKTFGGNTVQAMVNLV